MNTCGVKISSHSPRKRAAKDDGELSFRDAFLSRCIHCYLLKSRRRASKSDRKVSKAAIAAREILGSLAALDGHKTSYTKARMVSIRQSALQHCHISHPGTLQLSYVEVKTRA